jgi:hypothetical protein
MLETLLVISWLGAVDAPITHVTVFTDQARVTRTVQVAVSGTQPVAFPPLREATDLGSVRVEAQGAEVRRVDIERVTPEVLRTEEARALLSEYDQVELELDRVHRETEAWSNHLQVLQRLTPTLPVADAFKPAPKLNASGWAMSDRWLTEQLQRTSTKLRESTHQADKVADKRRLLLEKISRLGQPVNGYGWQVTAQLAGSGTATVTLTYAVRNARWTPSWDLQLDPATNKVSLALAGLVSQNTGEDWSSAALTLSTAVPNNAVQAPKLASWKIGTRDRFIPTPTPVVERPSPPPVRPVEPAVPSEADFYRALLLSLGRQLPKPQPGMGYAKKAVMNFQDEMLEGGLLAPEESEDVESAGAVRNEPMPPPPPSAPAPKMMAAPVAMAESVSVSVSSRKERQAQPMASFSLSPPPAWSLPSYGDDSPVTLAGGYDLTFASLQKETIPSGQGARRVALWSQQWPVSVERKLMPALSPDAFLVAELKNPSSQVLPGGPAQLHVGADPAGTAKLKLVSPGETFTLPLGIDRAIRPVRNVKVVDATEGLVSKDDVTTYTVTIELTNPYPAPVSLRLVDQWPLSTQKEVEVKLISTTPTATQDPVTGALEWRLTLKSQEKSVVTFSYSLRRPHGWRLSQSEVRP